MRRIESFSGTNREEARVAFIRCLLGPDAKPRPALLRRKMRFIIIYVARRKINGGGREFSGAPASRASSRSEPPSLWLRRHLDEDNRVFTPLDSWSLPVEL